MAEKIINRESPQPMYEQLKDLIKKKIMESEYLPDQPIPSALEFCERFDISKITVRQALSDLAKEGLLYGITGKGTFVTQAKREKGINLLKVLVPLPFTEKPGWFLEELMEGMKKSVEDNSKGYQLVFDFVGKKLDSDEEPQEPPYIKGLILLIAQEGEKHLLRYADSKIPAVVADYFAQGKTCIKVDNIAGGFKATAHLIKLGYKRIGHLRVSTSFDGSERFEGYKRALQKYKLPLEKRLVRESPIGKESACLATKRLLCSSPLPSAIFAPGYSMALGAMEAIREKGLKIPEDIALVGFDDLQINSAPEPALTTVKQPIFEMGHKAIKMLLDLIEGNLLEGERELLEPKLITRKSCGAYLKNSRMS